jgi:anti-sigma-K factor RskA
MTEPTDADVSTLATPYALHAMTDGELAHVDRLLAAASPTVAHAFAEEVRAVRETMAVISTATAVEPPDTLRDRLLASLDAASDSAPAPVVQLRPKKQPSQGLRWRTATLAAAAAVVIGLGGLGVGWVLHPRSTVTTQDQIFSASDVRTVTGEIPTGGTATVVFSRERNAGVLVMNNVNPPAQGTVYQMWLVGDDGPRSAGTMGAADVAPSTTAVLSDLHHSQSLAFTVEPGSGSTLPTTPVFAQLPLV